MGELQRSGLWEKVRMAALAIPAVRQILARLAKGDKEEEEFVEKIENSCLKVDHDKKGMLTPDEYFNVMKLQNGVDCTKEEVRTICGPLPCNKKGGIKIRDFLYLDIHSESAFRAMDRNKDGYITKGELKQAHGDQMTTNQMSSEVRRAMTARDSNVEAECTKILMVC